MINNNTTYIPVYYFISSYTYAVLYNLYLPILKYLKRDINHCCLFAYIQHTSYIQHAHFLTFGRWIAAVATVAGT